MKKKLLALLLVVVMVLSGCGQTAKLPEKDIVILYTNDVHCGVDDTIGYAGLAAYKAEMKAAGNEVLLVDAGDAIQGAPIGTVSKGEYITDIMNEVGYDLAIPGNHEFDYGMEQFLAITEKAEFPYISANFMDLTTNKPVLDAYKIFEVAGTKVAFVGISTPKTITTSTPVYFQNENGEFIYGFCQDETGEGVYAKVQAAVDAARKAGARFVIAVGHLGIEADCAPWTSNDIITNTTGIDVVIDGHSHSTVPCESVKNKEGNPVLLTQTGTKLTNIGKLVITTDGTITTELVSEYAEKDATADSFIGDIKAQYDAQMQTVVAHSDYELTIYQPDTDPAVRIVRNAETNLGDLCADAYRVIGGADIGFMNGGGVRASIAAGDITYENILTVMPFGNNLCVVEATGQQILDALEMGAKSVPSESGGFLHVSGLTYEIHTNVVSGVQLDTDGLFTGVEGEYRVQNVMVGGEPLDLAKTYTVASHDYMLKNCGDGFTMFKGCNVLKDMVMVDNQMLTTFIIENLGGVVGEEYSNPFGQERIIAVE